MHQQLVVVCLIGLVASVGALDLSHASKRSDELDPRVLNVVGNLYAQVIYPILSSVVEKLAHAVAQVLAVVSQNGIPAANGRTAHPSEAELRGFFGGLWNDALKPPLENAMTSMSLMLAQVLAGVGLNGVNLGIGKRDLTEAEMRGFADALNQAMNDIFSNVIQKPLENALSGGALMLAQMLAGLGTNGVNLSGLMGKRDLSDFAGHEAELRGIFGTVTGAILGGLQGVWNNVLQVPLENLVQNGALAVAGVLANLADTGVSLGKRSDEARGEIIDNLVGHALGLYGNQIKPLVESTINSALLQLAGALANFSQGSIGRR